VDSPPERAHADKAPGPSGRPWLAAGLLGLAVLLWGGYGRHWSWTGINGHTATLWDWLRLLLLPAAFAVMPVWMSRRTRLARRHKSIGVTVLGAFVFLVLVGYLAPWAWTGFSGNRLWDWLGLLLLPLVIALTPIFPELRAAWRRRHTLLGLAGLAVFGLVVLGGYLGKWTWTGFTGNTAWDWLHLLLLPLLIPIVVVPALMPLATAGVVYLKENDEEEAEEPPPAPAETGAEVEAGAAGTTTG
jgi:hypothetical protein